MLKKLISVMLINLISSGCAGTGFNKKMTAVPDQVKVEVKMNPEDNKAKEVVGGAVWNLK